MNDLRIKTLVVACALALAGASQAQTTRNETRFDGFAGSPQNASSLATGLREGKAVTLTSRTEIASFTPPTRPMGYGNVTRAIDLAQRDLAAAGITNPTPTQIQTAMMGGTIRTPTGDKAFQGVLTLRSQGKGWGQIAHTVGVHPGMGKSAAVAAPRSGAVVSGAGSASPKGHIVTAAGSSGGSVSSGNGRALGHSASPSVTTAAGASAGGAGGAASAHGQGNAFGHGK